MAEPASASAARDRAGTALVKRSMTLEGHRTSVALEPEFWLALETMAERRGQPLTAIVAQVDISRGDRPLASALRVYALRAASAR
jgi:predicted DNA-binding ribbon-helix-helix protein